MREIQVRSSRHYSVLVEPGLLKSLGVLAARETGAGRCAVLSDDGVFPLHGDRALAALSAGGMETEVFIFPQGEGNKTLGTYGQALNFLCDRGFTRSDIVVALGGGVVGDLGGFAAATYQRGIAYVQVPTTLLSMVDSSVGGKTAVDLPGGKNQAGCFYQPSLVVCDPDLLHTLPQRQQRCGWAEVIKMAMLFDAALFQTLKKGPGAQQMEGIIATCVALKRTVVEGDELDRGQRALLNFGHTLGHAVERCQNYRLTHGEAVAIGMAAVTRGAVKRGICPAQTLESLLELLEGYGLPTETDAPLSAAVQAARADKKRSGTHTALIVPEAVGRCRREMVTEQTLTEWFRDGGLS